MTAALEAGEWSAACPAALYPRERPGTHFTGGFGGPQSRSGWVEKSRPHRDSIPDRPTRSQSLYRMSYRAHPVSSGYHNKPAVRQPQFILIFLQNRKEEANKERGEERLNKVMG